jgi:hypothetical protein
MTQETSPLAEITNEALESMLKRAMRIALIFGLLAALVLWKAAGWRNAAMIATGAAISAASIYEWLRLTRYLNAKLDNKQGPRGAVLAAFSFVIRIMVFAAVIYGSLKCFRGSVVALLCGLSLSVLATVWEAMRLLRE